ncbi:MAG TPA: phospholipase, partial [Algoriphagus sp.]|nr:phospholipase [Algoriphagus sp.]
FGMNYQTEKASYTLDKLNEILHPDTVQKDRLNTEKILDNWKGKLVEEKPKMVLIAASGGGQRAALWTLSVLQNLYAINDGEVI